MPFVIPLVPARTPSVSSLDSLELTRYSDDGNAVHSDERVAVLEFELRKADETIKSLRASLTKASSEPLIGAAILFFMSINV